MKAYVFPGQGAQFVGMGQDLYNSSNEAKIISIRQTIYSDSVLPILCLQVVTKTSNRPK